MYKKSFATFKRYIILSACSLSIAGCGLLSKPTHVNVAPMPPNLLTAMAQSEKTEQVAKEALEESSAATPRSTINSMTDAAKSEHPYGIMIPPEQCWAQMVIHPRKKLSVQQIITKERAISYDVRQAQLKTEQQSITIRDSAESFRIEPPQYKKITEQVKVKDEIKKIDVEPAVYRDEVETVMVESARVEIRSCRGLGQRIVGPRQPLANQSQCAVSIPAKYQNVMRKVLVQPETLREITIPAVYQTITKQVLIENGKATPVHIPAQQINKDVVVIDTPALALQKLSASDVSNISVTTYENSPQLAWRRVVCEKESSSAMIEDLQLFLQREDSSPGPIDGKLGKRTMQAVEAYQIKNGIASGLLSYETLELMGLHVRKK